jgi:signal transduction histidine kinase
MSPDLEDPTTKAEADAKSARAIVWILDDSPLESALARRALSGAYDVEAFTDGSVLLERIASGQSPNVLLLDWQLPGMSGIEVLRFLRATRDEMVLPVLMLTVYGHKGDLVDGLGAGANDYLTKPYDAPELAARVATLVKINTLHTKTKLEEGRNADLLARERAARADAEAANRTKDEFLAMVSHDLRTPLNAILGWTRLVRGGQLPEEQIEKALATVERNALAQAQLIDELMDISRILSGKLTLDPQPVQLVGLIHAAMEDVRPSADAKQITLKTSVQLEAGAVVGDPTRLKQVIWNLLANAIKFTPKGGYVSISLQRAGDGVALSVTDSGRGIDPNFLPHVFERFRQAEVDGKRASGGGLGLGLAIVKQIAELHEGHVEAKSDGLDRGATFIVTIPSSPRGPSLPPAGELLPRPATPRDRKLDGLRVLVVDDDPDGLALLVQALQTQGADAFGASSAMSARQALSDFRPDVIVSDVGMPIEDGHALIRSVRLLSAENGGRIPALALTAFAGIHDRALALSAGFNMYATKPIDLSELVLSVARLAGRFES